jgi:hypothetical protein
MLQMINDDRSKNGLARSWLASNTEMSLLRLQKAGQVRTQPKTSEFLAIMCQMGTVVGDTLNHAVLWGQPGSNGFYF